MSSVDKGIRLLEITFSGAISSVDKGITLLEPLSTDDIAAECFISGQRYNIIRDDI